MRTPSQECKKGWVTQSEIETKTAHTHTHGLRGRARLRAAHQMPAPKNLKALTAHHPITALIIHPSLDQGTPSVLSILKTLLLVSQV